MLRCTACTQELPSAFPGATVVCVCGRSTTLPDAFAPSKRAADPSVGGPYRTTPTQPLELADAPCPYCGNRCPALARVCPHCDVRLENVRCGRCYSLQSPGSFACARCGLALELEPLLDATDAPCPRCVTPLEAAKTWDGEHPDAVARDARVHECPRCGGMFVPREALAEILCRAEVSGPFAAVESRPVAPLESVRYIPCPVCRASMNRVNFGKVSGVIVDVCRVHGTWFDGGELTRVVHFAAAGGLARTRAREADEKVARTAEVAAHRAALAQFDTKQEGMNRRLDLWREFLHGLLWW